MSDIFDSSNSDIVSDPESTTSDPESTTSDPESTTSDPESTTSDPESTTSDLESTTSDPESIISDPESTIGDSINEESSLSPDYVGTTTITNYYVPEASLDSVALDTFDRIVDSIPSYYGYLAYKASDTQYILLTGSEYSVADSTVTFGNDCILSTVNQIDSDFTFSTYFLSNQSYNVTDQEFVYTNMLSGYPSLGSNHLEYAPIFGIGLILVVLGSIFSRNSRR